MKKLSITLCLVLAAATSLAAQQFGAPFAQKNGGPFGADSGSLVRWRSIVGVITSQGASNPISPKIDSGTFAWSVQSGTANVSLTTGVAFFEVQGLVINGTAFSGTPGPVTSVVGTLVCNPGDAVKEVAVDTNQVPLNDHGNAVFSGFIPNIPSGCGNPLFLIRIANPAGAAGRWIATGAGRSLPNQGQ